MNPALASLLQHPAIWRGNGLASPPALPSGHGALDALLPGGGWPVGALTEILVEREGIGELRLILPLLAPADGARSWLAWIAPPHLPYAPALVRGGVDLSRTLLVHPGNGRETLWAAEQAMRSGACGVVLAWLGDADERALRRLQLAAEAGRTCGMLFDARPAPARSSPAALRLRVTPAPRGIAVHILKRRGGPVAAPVFLDFERHAVAQPPLPPSPPGNLSFHQRLA